VDSGDRVRYHAVLDNRVAFSVVEVARLVAAFQATDGGKHLALADWKGEADTVANTIPAIQHYYGTLYGEGEHRCPGCPQDNTVSSVSHSLTSRSLSRTGGEKSLHLGFGNRGDCQSRDGLSGLSGVSKEVSKVSQDPSDVCKESPGSSLVTVSKSDQTHGIVSWDEKVKKKWFNFWKK